MQLGLSGNHVSTSYFCHRPLAVPSLSLLPICNRSFRAQKRCRCNQVKVIMPRSWGSAANTECDTDDEVLLAFLVAHWSPLNLIIIISFYTQRWQVVVSHIVFFFLSAYQVLISRQDLADGWFRLNPDMASVYWVLLTVGKLQSHFLTDTLVSHLLPALKHRSSLHVSPDRLVNMLAGATAEVFAPFDLLMLNANSDSFCQVLPPLSLGCLSLLRRFLKHQLSLRLNWISDVFSLSAVSFSGAISSVYANNKTVSQLKSPWKNIKLQIYNREHHKRCFSDRTGKISTLSKFTMRRLTKKL